MAIDPRTLERLVATATAARERARAPYSRFAVGAAVVDSAGRFVGGCNVENASYGLTMCAERVALFRAVAEDLGEIAALAVAVDGAAPVAPCGACRQVMIELCPPAAEVILAPLDGGHRIFTVASLLPEAFTAHNLGAPDPQRE